MSELLALATIIALLVVPGNCDSGIIDQVEIIMVGDVQQEDVRLVEEVLGSLPQHHLLRTDCECALHNVTLVAGHNLEDLPSDAAVFERNPDYDASRVGGLAELETGDVYVAADGDLEGVLYHEIGHIVFDGPAKLNNANVLATWQLVGLYAAGDVSLGPYSRKNAREFRAEAYEACAVGKPMSPEVFDVMDKFFGGCTQ